MISGFFYSFKQKEWPDLSDHTTEQLVIMEIRILKELDWCLCHDALLLRAVLCY